MSLSYCPLFSGSSGNAAILGTGLSKILIDAGMSGKYIESALSGIGVEAQSISAILITHEHIDHVQSAGVLSRKYNIPIFANSKTWMAMQKKVGIIAGHNMRVFESNHDFFIGDCNITPIAISHDTVDPVGFSFVQHGKKIVQLTDLGYFHDDLLDYTKDADVVLLESNHDVEKLMHCRRPIATIKRIRSNRGHLSNEQAGEAAAKLLKAGCRRLILGHLSSENNTPRLAYQSVSDILLDNGYRISQDYELYLALQDRPCGIFRL